MSGPLPLGQGLGPAWGQGERQRPGLLREDVQVLFSVLPGGASLYLGFMARKENRRSLFLQKSLRLTPHFCPKELCWCYGPVMW